MSHKDKPQNTENRGPIEGEGSRSADEAYRRRTKAFIDSGKVDESAREAKRAVEDEEEGEELRRAEAEGRAHAAEEDPEVVLDRRKKGVTPEE